MAIENIKEKILYLLSILFRFYPFSHEVKLLKFGNPTPDSPLFVSGDYIYTVVRLKKELKDKDCYLLITHSAGSNVWCAGGVGDFNEHKIADAVNAFGLKNIVKHRKLILSQLSAVGIDRDILFKECGFRVEWGPANYYNINEYFSNGLMVKEKMRLVHWSFRDRLYIAVGKLIAYYLLFFFYFIYVLFFGTQYNNYALFIVFALFWNISITAFPLKQPFKWPPTYVVAMGTVLSLGTVLYAYFINPSMKEGLPYYLIWSVIVTLFIASDSAATDKVKTTLSHWLKTFNTMSLFQPKITDKCTRCGECIEVCPKGLISRSKDQSVVIDLKYICCECLACVKQCKDEAIININKGLYKKDIKVIPNIEKIMGCAEEV